MKFLLLILLFAEKSFASNWPIFSIPIASFLKTTPILTSQNCLKGKLRAINSSTLNVASLCHTHCPMDWRWVANSAGACFNANTFRLENYQISYLRNNNGVIDYSIIKATYGNNNNSNLFSLIFITPQHEHWYCIKQNQNMITCANDI